MPRWLLTVLGVAVGIGIDVGATLLLTRNDDEDASSTSTEEVAAGPTTSTAELASIETSAAEWQVIFDGTSQRARQCEQRADAGIEGYEECAFREIGEKGDAAADELALEYARLRPQVDPECADALERAGRR